MPLGRFLTLKVNELEETCENDCKSQWGNHTINYLRQDGSVKLYFTRVPKFSEIQFIRKCKICDSEPKPENFSKIFWELSYHKFLHNFFCENVFFSQKCGHEYYRDSIFIFNVETSSFVFEFHKINYYELAAPSNQINKEYYEKLKVSCFEEFRDAGRAVLDDLFRSTKDLLMKISLKHEDDVRELQSEESLQLLTEDINRLDKEITNVLLEHMQIDLATLQNHLHVEMHRRMLFVECCHSKMNLETLKERFRLMLNKNNKDRKKSVSQVEDNFTSIYNMPEDNSFAERPSEYLLNTDELSNNPS